MTNIKNQNTPQSHKKTTKHQQISTKKLRILSGVLAGVSILAVAGATVATVFAFKNKNGGVTPIGEYTVSLSASENGYFDNTTEKILWFNNVKEGTKINELVGYKQPKKNGYHLKEKKWIDSVGNEYNETDTITSNLCLVGNFRINLPDFTNCDWSIINEKCTALEDGNITETEFCNSFLINDEIPTSMDDFIGVERKVQLKHQDLDSDGVIDDNEVTQTVRVIGTSHDDSTKYQVNTIGDGSKKAALTFEFKDLISDENGYSLATYWANAPTNSGIGTNYNYFNSSVRKALNNTGNGDLHWFRYYGSEEDTAGTGKNRKWAGEELYQKSVLQMLPNNLASVLKSPQNRVVNTTTNDWTGSLWPTTEYETKISDKLFLPSPGEYNDNLLAYDTEYLEQSMKPYRFYNKSTFDLEKNQIKTDGGRTTALEGSDLDGDFPSKKYSCAGLNNFNAYWLQSPYTWYNIESLAWCVDLSVVGPAQLLTYESIYDNAYPIAPAFCI